MKKSLLILLVIFSLAACNDSARPDPNTGCNVIVWSYLTPGQQATLTGFGYKPAILLNGTTWVVNKKGPSH